MQETKESLQNHEHKYNEEEYTLSCQQFYRKCSFLLCNLELEPKIFQDLTIR